MSDMMINLANKILSDAMATSTNKAVKTKIQNTVLVNGGYCEPGFDQEKMHIAIGDFDTVLGEQPDDKSHATLGMKLIELGFELVDSKKWVECDKCLGVFKMSGEVNDDGAICYRCMKSESKVFITTITPEQFLKGDYR